MANAPRRRRPTIDDVARARRRLLRGGVVRDERPPRRGGGDAQPDPARRRGAGLAPERARPGARRRHVRARSACCCRGRSSSSRSTRSSCASWPAIERTLARSDHALVLRVIDSDEPLDLDVYVRLAASGRVDGFLLCDVELDDDRFELLAGLGLAAVVAGHPVSPCPFPWLETRARARDRDGGRAPGRARASPDRLRRRSRALRARAGAAGGVARGARGGRPRPRPRRLRRSRRGPRRGADGDRPLQRHARGRGAARGARGRRLGPGAALDHGLRRLAASPRSARRRITSVRVDYAQFGEAAAAALLATIAREDPPAFEPADAGARRPGLYTPRSGFMTSPAGAAASGGCRRGSR